ncbi:MAG: ABC transporter substrate-binding protein [Dehalococcoidia bacterium]
MHDRIHQTSSWRGTYRLGTDAQTQGEAMESEYWSRFQGSRMTRRGVLGGAGVLGAGAAALAIVGCGDDDDDELATASATQAAAAANPGGTLRLPVSGVSSGQPATIFPFENLTYLAQTPAAYHYSRLLRSQSNKDIAVEDKTVLEGDVVAQWEQMDPVTYRFAWKPNVKWQNKAPLNGKAATAHDFVTTYNAFLKTSQNQAKFSAVIDSLTAPDEKTLVAKLKSPFAPFLTSMAASTEGVWFIPAETIDSGQAKQDPIGTGPFTFSEWNAGISIKWDRNPDYYDAPYPYFAKVEAGLSNDAQRIVAALKSGDLDMSQLNGVIYKASRSELDPKGQDWFIPTGVIGAIYFNFDNKPFNDRRVRQAISHILDRDGYLRVQDGTGKGDWNSHLSPAMAPYYLSPKDAKFGPNAKYFQKNWAEAKALLSAAGADALQGIRLVGNVDRYGPEARQSWELFSNDLKAAGFNHELVFQEGATYIQTTFLGKMDPNTFAVGPLIGSPADPDDIFVTNYWSKSVRHNWGGTPIAEQASIDADIEKQRTILDRSERIAFIHELQRKMAESMLVVPYHASAGHLYNSPSIQNFFYKSGYGYMPDGLMKASFTKERVAKG